jgi:peptidoglycan-associated lipoprotein
MVIGISSLVESGRTVNSVLLIVLVSFAVFLCPLSNTATAGEADRTSQHSESGAPALAGILTVLNVPARGMACGLSGVLGSVVMLASGGVRYPLAAEIMQEGCSGPWVITPEMVHESRLPRKEAEDVVPPLAEKRGSEPAAVEHVTNTVQEPDSLSSLDALRRGEVPSTAPSSPLAEIHFDFDSYELRPEARKALEVHADWLNNNPSVRVEIEGHCDERGSSEYNMALGAKRAQAAKAYLVDLAVAADRLSTISYGEELPICREHTEECWQRNRRDRFVIVASGPPS